MKRECKTCIYGLSKEYCPFETNNPDKVYCDLSNDYINYKPKIKVPDNFDVNVFNVLRESLDSHIKEGDNIIGSSGIAMCKRGQIISIILKKRGIKIPFVPNNKMLFGEMFEDVLYIPKVLANLVIAINDALGLNNEDMQITPQVQKFIEVFTGKEIEKENITEDMRVLRVTPDIPVNPYYMVEVKTTGVYVRQWKRELAANQVVQLNTQLGTFGIMLGFILKVSSRFALAKITKFTGEDYWDKLWLDYGYILPWEFDKQLYDDTLDRVRDIFIRADKEDFNVDGPEMGWECGYCKEPVRKTCGREKFQCTAPKCYKDMYEYPELVTDKFKALAMCQKHFKEFNPHSKYEKFKYKEYFS